MINHRARARRILAAVIAGFVAVLLTAGVGDTPRADAAAGWDVRTQPPVSPNPTSIQLSANSPTDQLPAWGILCSGRYHRIELGRDEDALITFSGSTPLRYPIWIVGGRNVRVVGLEMALETQPGCGVGQLPNTGSTAKNIHPRIPGAMAIRLENWGTSFVEGTEIDLRGHEADCFVVRNPAGLSNADARNQRHVVLQNAHCRGIEGLGQSAIGDGVHGDLLQNQGNDVISTLTIENVTVRSSMEGLVLHEWDGYAGARSMTIRRFDYSADPRYANDDAYEQWGTAFAAWAEQWTLESVYIDDPKGMDYGFVNRQRWGATARGAVLAHAGVHDGRPAGGEFAPPSRVGAEYVSPHGGSAAPTLAGSASRASNKQIDRLYRAAFGRQPDAAGYAFWVERAQEGMTLTQMAEFFSHSDEWKQRFGTNNSAQDLVRIMYRNVLERDPDAGGAAYWTGRLSTGLSRAGLLVQFSESQENVARTS